MNTKEFWNIFSRDSDEERRALTIQFRNELPVYLDWIEDRELFAHALKEKYIEINPDDKTTAMLPHTPDEEQYKLLQYMPKQGEATRCGSRNIDDFPREAQKIGLVIDNFNRTTDKWHRCGIEGKGRGNTSGSYRIEDKGSYFFIYGLNFTTGQDIKFDTKEATKSLSNRTSVALEKNAQMYTQARLKAEDVIGKKRGAEAKALWESLERAQGTEPYAQKKGIQHMRLLKRLPSGDLVVPLFNINREVTSIQTLNPEHKFLMKDCVKKGSFAVVGGAVPDPANIIVGEGFATVDSALSLFKDVTQESQHVMGFAAIDCHNMREVVMEISNHYPKAQIFLALDNDKQSVRNAGMEAGEFIVQALPNVHCLTPDFGDERSCDWNDLFLEKQHLAIEQMKEQITGKYAVVEKKPPLQQRIEEKIKEETPSPQQEEERDEYEQGRHLMDDRLRKGLSPSRLEMFERNREEVERRTGRNNIPSVDTESLANNRKQEKVRMRANRPSQRIRVKK